MIGNANLQVANATIPSDRAMFTFVGAESINSGATTPWAVVDSGKLKNAGARCRHDPAESANGRPMGRKGGIGHSD